MLPTRPRGRPPFQCMHETPSLGVRHATTPLRPPRPPPALIDGLDGQSHGSDALRRPGASWGLRANLYGWWWRPCLAIAVGLIECMHAIKRPKKNPRKKVTAYLTRRIYGVYLRQSG